MSAAETSLRRDADLEANLRRALAGFEVKALDTRAHRHAAVALAVVDEGHGADLPGLPTHATWSDRAAMILTRRSAELRNHPGQWALPGGRLDDGETPEQAALRELDEEVGLRAGAESILGRLDDFVTRSGYIITPVVVWAGAGRPLKPNPAEVASVHRIPLDELLREDAPMLEHAHPERTRCCGCRSAVPGSPRRPPRCCSSSGS